MEINFKRQEALQDLCIPKISTIIGTGAVGCWLAYFSTLAGTEKLIIYTIGNVKSSDIARFPFLPQMLNMSYSSALPEILRSIRPNIDIQIHEAFRPNIDNIEGIVFNCAASDLKDFDAMVYNQCLSKGLRYITSYYSNHTIYSCDYYSEKIPLPSLAPVPAWSGTAALAGLMALYTCSLPSGSANLRVLNMMSGKFQQQFKEVVTDDVAR
jgi:hypothetical protein